MIISYNTRFGIYNQKSDSLSEFEDGEGWLKSLDHTQIRGNINEEMKLSFASGMLKLSSTDAPTLANKNHLAYTLSDYNHNISAFLQLGDIFWINVDQFTSNSIEESFVFIGFISEIKIDSKGNNSITVQNAAYHLGKMKYNATGKAIKEEMKTRKIQLNSDSDDISFQEMVRRLGHDYNKVIGDRYGTSPIFSDLLNVDLLDAVKISEESLEKNAMRSDSTVNTEFDMIDFRADQSTALEIIKHMHKNYLVDFNITSFISFTKEIVVEYPEGFPNEQKSPSLDIQFTKAKDKTFILNVLFAGFLTTQSFESDSFAGNLILKNYDLRYENQFVKNGEEVVTKEKIRKKLESIDPNIASASSSDKTRLGLVTNRDLRWQKESDVQVNAHFKIIGDNNKITEFKFGTGGETLSYVQFGNIKKDVLEEMAKNRLNKKKYTGYRPGSMIQTYLTNLRLFDNLFVLDVLNEFTAEEFRNYVEKDISMFSKFQIIAQKFTINKITKTFNGNSGFKTNVFIGNLISSNVVEEEDNNKLNNIYDMTVPRLFATVESTITRDFERRLTKNGEIIVTELKI